MEHEQEQLLLKYNINIIFHSKANSSRAVKYRNAKENPTIFLKHIYTTVLFKYLSTLFV